MATSVQEEEIVLRGLKPNEKINLELNIDDDSLNFRGVMQLLFLVLEKRKRISSFLT